MIRQILLLIPLILFISGCRNSEPEDIKIKEPAEKKITLSPRTEITASEITDISISIPTAVCGTCQKNISKAVNKLEGITSAEIDVKKKTALISYDIALTSPEEIRKAISEAGYDADDVKRNLSAYDKLDECCKIESGVHG